MAPLRAANALAIKATFQELILSRWGTPEILHSDRGTEHANNLLDELAKEYGSHRSFSPVYHAQANPVERTNRVLKTTIVSFVEQDDPDWDLYLKDFMFAYNTSVHSTAGYTPAFSNMGREPKARNSIKRRAEGRAKIPPPDVEGWESRMGSIAHLRDWITQKQDQVFLKQAKYYNRGKILIICHKNKNKTERKINLS